MTSLRSLSESSSLPDRSSTLEASNLLSRSLSSRALRSVSSSLNNNDKQQRNSYQHLLCLGSVKIKYIMWFTQTDTNIMNRQNYEKNHKMNCFILIKHIKNILCYRADFFSNLSVVCFIQQTLKTSIAIHENCFREIVL